MSVVLLPDLASVAAFGARIAGKLREGDVVALEGPLGAGKTTLARAIIAALGHEGDVPSPTFSLLEIYETTRIPIVHADFYRLDDPSQVQELGIDDYRDYAALIAEWPERAGGFVHEAGCLQIRLEIVGDARKAIVTAGADWHGRLP